MKKIFLPLGIVSFLILTAATVPFITNQHAPGISEVSNLSEVVAPDTPICSSITPDVTKKVLSDEQLHTLEVDSLYGIMQLNRVGLNKKAFSCAYKGYKKLIKNGYLHAQVLSVCDFSQSSRRKRMYVLDLNKNKLVLNTFVAHGRNSGGEYATSFSNSMESHKTSLGFYITKNTYQGEYGKALKIEGIEHKINDKAAERNIVVHGSNYVGGDFLKAYHHNGRSYGCPAVPVNIADKLINHIKGGTCLFIYHPTKEYLKRSVVLNG
jgi:L,D-transpeptidase catalytic domain